MAGAWQARDEAATIATDSHAGTVQDAIGFLRRADTLLEQAQAHDPDWQQPLIDRGWVAWSIARLLPLPAEAVQLQTAASFADSALHRAPSSAAARELRGTVLWQTAKITMGASSMTDVAVAERDLRAAVAAESTNARAWGTLSEVLRFKGDVAEANVGARRALAQDAYLEAAPRILEALFTSEQLLGDYAAAGQYCDQGRRRFPNDWRFVQCRLALGQPDVALRLLSEYVAARPALRAYIARDPHFAALRNDPRFAARFTALLRAPRE